MNTHNGLCSNVANAIRASEQIYKIRLLMKRTIMLVPIIVILLQLILMLHPISRRASLWMLEENHPVELLTFMLFMAAGVFGLRLAMRTRQAGEGAVVYGFYGLFSVCLLFIAMEEIAWGQSLFGFDTPGIWRAINRQGETTFHNVSGLHGHSEIMRLTFGIGGLVGVWLRFFPSFRKIGVPTLLLPWFIIISIHASIDVYNDIIPIDQVFDYMMEQTAELIELFIAISAFLTIHLNSRMQELSPD